MKIIFINVITVIYILLFNTSYGEELQSSNSFVKIKGSVMAVEDISAIAKIDQFILIASDEGAGKANNENYIQLLKMNADGIYVVHNNILLFKGNKSDGNEMDIEGIAVDDNNVYIIGSHSLTRKKIKPGKNGRIQQ